MEQKRKDILKMAHKTLLAKFFKLNPEDRRLDTLLSDPEVGACLQSLLDEFENLRKRAAEIKKEIRTLCKRSPKDWDPVIENVISTETGHDALAAKKTRERKKEIEHAVKVALSEGMGPGDIRAIIEVMVMGMQPGDACFLLGKDSQTSECE